MTTVDIMASVRRRVTMAAAWLTTPVPPEDYLALFDPLRSWGELLGRVEAVRPETADTATLVIRPGRGWVQHRAGQWIRVGVDVAGRRHWRTFSLSSPPGRPDGRVTITVKSMPGGLVSGHLVRRAAPGTIIRLSLPSGEFVLPDPLPPRVLFLTAGSGITPVMAMLESLSAAAVEPDMVPVHSDMVPVHSDMVLVHSAPTPEDVIFGARLRELAARSAPLRLHEQYTRSRGRLRPPDLAAVCPDWRQRDVWACGPAAMLDELVASWTGPADRLHIERFRPRASGGGGTGGRVWFLRSGRVADAGARTPLLTVGEDAGVLMPSGCRMGICHSCVARLRSGRVRDLRTGQVHGEDGDLIQTCVSAAAGPVEIDL